MSEETKKYNYTIGIYDVICRDIRMKVKEEAEKEGVYGIGLYTDRYCEQELMTRPMKNIDERMEIARCYECLGENDNALEYLDKIVEIFPDNEDAHEMIRKLS